MCWKDYLGAVLCLRFVCGISRYVHDLPRRAHRWHILTVCGVHFALAAVHATHALLLTIGVVGFMMLYGAGAWEKRNDRSSWMLLRKPTGKNGFSGRGMAHPAILHHY